MNNNITPRSRRRKHKCTGFNLVRDNGIRTAMQLGAKVAIQHGMVIAEAPELSGSHIYLDIVSVGATINIMLRQLPSDVRFYYKS